MSLFQRYLGRKFASYNNMLQWVIAGRLGLWFKDTAVIRRQNFLKIDDNVTMQDTFFVSVCILKINYTEYKA